MFKMFAFSFETRITITSPLLNRSINEAPLVADHFNQMPYFSSSTYLAGF